MTNLKNYSNIFSDLAQGAYTERVKGKMLAKPSDQQQDDIENKGYATYNFGDSTQAVYLQPDKTGALTNAKAGYNAYFVTDQPSVSDSRETYFVTDETKLIQALSFFIFRNFFAISFYFWYYYHKMINSIVFNKIKTIER